VNQPLHDTHNSSLAGVALSCLLCICHIPVSTLQLLHLQCISAKSQYMSSMYLHCYLLSIYAVPTMYQMPFPAEDTLDHFITGASLEAELQGQ
jgi:hypothetical protein